MLAVVVAAPPAVRALTDLAALPAAADLVELRLDLLPVAREEAEIRSWIEAAPRPVIATVRSRAQGGAFEGTPREAAAWLMLAARAGAAWIDAEAAVAPHLVELPEAVRIVTSRHGDGDPDGSAVVAGRPVAQRKIARRVATPSQLDRVRAEARASVLDRDVTIVPYGPLGGLRAAFVHPESLLFGSAASASAVVEGQPALVELLDELRAGEVGPDASLYGLLGTPPARSPSPAMHNAAFRVLGREALYLPLPGLAPAEAVRLPFAGFSVTMPWKEEALKLARRADPLTRAIGATNTLIRDEEGGWRAVNTDADAIREAVPEARPGEQAYVYGTGGYARAAYSALGRRGYQVRVGGRNEKQGRAWSDGESVEWGGAVYERRPEDAVLVNATPVGARGRTPSFVAGASLKDLFVLDAPYREPGRSTGLADRALGEARRYVSGRELLALQARGQTRAFTGCDVDASVFELALSSPPSLVLLGLRGAGKTTVGRALARRLGRPFLDLDDEVRRRTGRPAGWWIRERGEVAFRAAEAEVVDRLAGRRGVVVAAGGGVLDAPASRRTLAAHTTPVLLDVTPETASARVRADPGDRPSLHAGEDPLAEARRLQARRREGWLGAARQVVDATRGIDVVTDEVASWWIATARSCSS